VGQPARTTPGSGARLAPPGNSSTTVCIPGVRGGICPAALAVEINPTPAVNVTTTMNHNAAHATVRAGKGPTDPMTTPWNAFPEEGIAGPSHSITFAAGPTGRP
jgi:hypothetical protein